MSLKWNTINNVKGLFLFIYNLKQFIPGNKSFILY